MHAAPSAAEESLWARFPQNTFVHRLLERCKQMGVRLGRSGVEQQWLYHPAYRTVYVWEPDLENESLSYIVVILAHELGHAIDFDLNPAHVTLTRELSWWEAPDFIEKAAFVNGFRILKELHIPFSLDHYAGMIDERLAGSVIEEIERDHLCCLMSERRPVDNAITTPLQRVS